MRANYARLVMHAQGTASGSLHRVTTYTQLSRPSCFLTLISNREGKALIELASAFGLDFDGRRLIQGTFQNREIRIEKVKIYPAKIGLFDVIELVIAILTESPGGGGSGPRRTGLLITIKLNEVVPIDFRFYLLNINRLNRWTFEKREHLTGDNIFDQKFAIEGYPPDYALAIFSKTVIQQEVAKLQGKLFLERRNLYYEEEKVSKDPNDLISNLNILLDISTGIEKVWGKSYSTSFDE